MSKKDVDLYYTEITNNYLELLDTLKDMESDVASGMISPERLDNLKKVIQPIKDNYETISYIVYLLNKPARKEKVHTYEKQNKKILAHIPYDKTKEGIIENNRHILDNIKI